MPRGKTASDWDRRIDRLIRDFKLPDRGALEKALRDAGTEYRVSLDWGTGTPDGVGEADALDRLRAAVRQLIDLFDEGHPYDVVVVALAGGDENKSASREPAMTMPKAEAWLADLTERLARLDRTVADIHRRRYGQGAPPKNEPVYAMIKEVALYWESTGKRFRQSKKPDGGSAFVRAAIPLVLEPVRELWDQEPEFPERPKREFPAPKGGAVQTVIERVVRELRNRRLGIKG